ncbi:hypothetical protein AUK04_01445 [Candidatus Roizmanbacteria bacterium CG2_30_33_16]|uniref:Uncharacterized protein n=4 Tax=Candidatus Roizmaniibacteriota TaxID=1752723 RepID=A0A2M7E5G9_9BACT|nr:hypothetical protein [Candidatus Roizmanbacteria bacterium]OIP85199.1 MAG: hypothetical protein AUK04_01445 [Candidatus Roizmanbacteria bacterium CG2_30_33_16]PIP64662.1 MAG: hypothetical protein COW96_01265 [Candidatus Roizmanbacteria bacterium CG22_combo_CG10-13_8_21_14_all_33_16]PIV62982.1 MAG: hypothetical protein COS12_00335 [Candidatus Roizmanbacteria bacterium CG01_land_8_20_14_3_00_33_9]PJB88144.1 MAG: hypothetical protein CO083_03315 [Candidatus Roizmanbacteria bacterium CG_4_9_14_0
MFKKYLNLLTNKVKKFDKRIRVVVGTLFMSGIMLIATFYFFDKAWIFIPIFLLVTYVVTWLTISEGIRKVEWIMLFVIPLFFTISLYFFYFLFPVRWLTRFPFIILYGVSLYAILLTVNIFNVGVKTNLQLYRAAFSVNYFFQVLLFFLIINVILSLQLNFLINGISLLLLTAVMLLHLLWTVKLDLIIEKEIFYYCLIIGIIMAELAVWLSFIPMRAAISALLLSASYYSLAGLVYSYFNKRFFKEIIREYIFVIGFVILISFLSLRW